MSQAHGRFLKLPYSYRDFRNGIHDLAIAVGVERLPARTLTLTPPTFSLRKEVIQPQVLLRLPCYDFTPIMNHTLGVGLRTSSTIHFRDVTGGVYKARERIHGIVLICHY
jgi:hypothetical protein